MLEAIRAACFVVIKSIKCCIKCIRLSISCLTAGHVDFSELFHGKDTYDWIFCLLHFSLKACFVISDYLIP